MWESQGHKWVARLLASQALAPARAARAAPAVPAATVPAVPAAAVVVATTLATAAVVVAAALAAAAAPTDAFPPPPPYSSSPPLISGSAAPPSSSTNPRLSSSFGPRRHGARWATAPAPRLEGPWFLQPQHSRLYKSLIVIESPSRPSLGNSMAPY